MKAREILSYLIPPISVEPLIVSALDEVQAVWLGLLNDCLIDCSVSCSPSFLYLVIRFYL